MRVKEPPAKISRARKTRSHKGILSIRAHLEDDSSKKALDRQEES